MAYNKHVFTLKEISTHLMNQVIMSDTDFQLNQRDAWLALGKTDEAYAGYAKLSALFLSEIDYSFELMPRPFSKWDKFKQFFRIPLKSNRSNYAIADANTTPANLKIKISIKRESQGKYDTSIETVPPTPLKPEEINVIGFTK